MNSLIIVATFLISAAVGIVVGMSLRKKIAESKIQGAEQEAKRLVDLAKIEAENMKKEEIIKAKEEIMKSPTKENAVSYNTLLANLLSKSSNSS